MAAATNGKVMVIDPALQLEPWGGAPTGPQALAAPQNRQASPSGQGALSVTGSSVANSTGYQLYQASAEAGPYLTLGGILSSPTFLHTSLAAATVYYYKWQTLADGVNYSNSALSDSFSGMTLADDLPQPVQGATIPQVLPRVYLTAQDPQNLTDVKQSGTMRIVYADGAEQNFLTKIKKRGNSTSTYPKIPFGVETVDAAGADVFASILGLPSGSDWAFLAEYKDPWRLNNYTLLRAGRILNNTTRWSPTPVMVEIWYENVYQGLYTGTEKIKRHTNRVNLDKPGITPETITGGYLQQQVADSQELPADLVYTTPTWTASRYLDLVNGRVKRSFTSEYPKVENLVPETKSYISGRVNDFEYALNHRLPDDIAEGWLKYIDVAAAVDLYIQKETSKDVDGPSHGIYFSQARGGKIMFGPGWDFDQAFGNYLDAATDILQEPTGYRMRQNFWFNRFFFSTTFRQALAARWAAVRASFYALADEMEANVQVLLTNGVADRDYAIWPETKTYAAHAADKIAFFRDRLAWMDTALVQTGPEHQVVYTPGFTKARNQWSVKGSATISNNTGVIQNSVYDALSVTNFIEQPVAGMTPQGRFRLELKVTALTSGAATVYTETGDNGHGDLVITSPGIYATIFTSENFGDRFRVTGHPDFGPANFSFEYLTITLLAQEAVPATALFVAPASRKLELAGDFFDHKFLPKANVMDGLLSAGGGTAGLWFTGARIAVHNYRAIKTEGQTLTPQPATVALLIDGVAVGAQDTTTVEPTLLTTTNSTHLLEMRWDKNIAFQQNIPAVTVLRGDNSPLPVPGSFSGAVGPSTGAGMVTLAYNHPARTQYVNGSPSPWPTNGGAFGGKGIVFPPQKSPLESLGNYEQVRFFLPVDSLVRFWGRKDGQDRTFFDLVVDEQVFTEQVDTYGNGGETRLQLFAVVLPAGEHTTKTRQRGTNLGYLEDITIETI